LSIVAWGIGFGWLGVHEPSKWEIAAGLYIVGRKFMLCKYWQLLMKIVIAYQTTLTFWTAA